MDKFHGKKGKDVDIAEIAVILKLHLETMKKIVDAMEIIERRTRLLEGLAAPEPKYSKDFIGVCS
jgi:hypothetical protein